MSKQWTQTTLSERLPPSGYKGKRAYYMLHSSCQRTVQQSGPIVHSLSKHSTHCTHPFAHHPQWRIYHSRSMHHCHTLLLHSQSPTVHSTFPQNPRNQLSSFNVSEIDQLTARTWVHHRNLKKQQLPNSFSEPSRTGGLIPHYAQAMVTPNCQTAVLQPTTRLHLHASSKVV